MTSPAPVALVSGGNRGLGAAIVRQCLDAGFRVATFARSATSFVEETSRSDGAAERFHFESVDGSDDGALKSFVTGVGRRFGRIDALVNNAGIGRFGLFSTAPLADLDQSIAVNLRAGILLTRLCTPHLMNAGSGSIVNVSSVNAVRGNSGVAVYSATKAALDGFTRALARELGPRAIRVNSVAPGYFESEMTADLDERQMRKLSRGTPLGRLGTAEEIARVVLFLISDEASFVTGQTLVVDGGLTC